MNLRDLKHAARSLIRRPTFAVLGVLLAALAVGLQALLATVLHGVLLRPLPMGDPGRLVQLWGVVDDFGIDEYPFSWPNYLDYRDLPDSPLTALAAYRSAPVTLAGEGRPRSLTAARVTLNLLDTLGVEPQLGTGFQSDGSQTGAVGQVLISDRLWHSEWSADAGVVGRSVRLDGVVHEVVGVLPATLRFPGASTDLMVPLVPTGNELERGFHFLRVTGRLRAEHGLEQAESQLVAVAKRLQVEYPGANDRLDLRVSSLFEEQVGRVREALGTLGLAVQVLFVLAGLNLAGLLLSRALERRSELGLRCALGASRWRSLRATVGEGLLIALTGGVVGVVAAALVVGLLRGVDPSLLPRVWELRVDGPTALWALVCVVAAALACSFGPAWVAAGSDAARLMAGGRGSRDVQGRRSQRLLVVAQVAVAVPLLLGALAVTRHVDALRRVDLGYPLDHRLTAGLALPLSQFDSPERQDELVGRALEALAALPGVEEVGMTSRLPLSPGNASLVVHRPDFEVENPPNANYRVASEGLFPALDIELLEGRLPGRQDDRGGAPVVVIDEELSADLFVDSSPLGRVVRMGALEVDWTVIGVVRSVELLDPEGETTPTIWVPSRQNVFVAALRTPQFVLRTATAPEALTSVVRQTLQAVDPEQAVLEVRALTTQLDDRLVGHEVVARLLSALAAAALTIAGVGLYAVLRASVTRQRFELGVRAALGAGSRKLQGQVLAEALAPVVVGMTMGLGLTAVIAESLTAFGPGAVVAQANPFAWSALAGALGALVGTAMAAALPSVRRVARTDPAGVLRSDAR